MNQIPLDVRKTRNQENGEPVLIGENIEFMAILKKLARVPGPFT